LIKTKLTNWKIVRMNERGKILRENGFYDEIKKEAK
jgi:hypothetical protein